MKQYLKTFVHEDDGAELVEYAIVVGIVAVVAAAVFAVVSMVRKQVDNAANEIGKLDVNSSGGGAGGAVETPGGDGTGNATIPE